jgi:hypothetical protein
MTGLLLILVVVGAIRYRAQRAAGRKARWTLVLLGLVFPLAILVYGSAMHATGANWTPRPGADLAPTVIYSCLAAHAAWVAFAVWRSHGARGIVAALAASEVWWSLGAAFVALMSVSGKWL